MIHSTSTMITPMTIQVAAVEDMKNSSEGLLPASMYGAPGAKGRGARAGAGKRSSRRDRHPRTARPAALGTFSYAGGGRARHHLDSRWSRGDARRRHLSG